MEMKTSRSSPSTIISRSRVSVFNHYFTIRIYSLSSDEHFLARGVVEEPNMSLARSIGGDIGSPENGATEVCHGRDDMIVFCLESLTGVKALEVGAANALITGCGETMMAINIDLHAMVKTFDCIYVGDVACICLATSLTTSVGIRIIRCDINTLDFIERHREKLIASRSTFGSPCTFVVCIAIIYNPLYRPMTIGHIATPFTPTSLHTISSCRQRESLALGIVEHGIFLSQELENGWLWLAKVTNVVKFSVNIIIDGSPATTIVLILKNEVIIGEITSFGSNRNVLKHIITLSDRHKTLFCRRFFALFTDKEIRTLGDLHACFKRTDEARCGRNLAIHTYQKGLLLIIDRSVEEHLPLSIHERKFEGIITISISLGTTIEALSVLIVENDLKIHVIDRIPFAVFVEFAKHIEFVFHWLHLFPESETSHLVPIVTSPPLSEHEHIGSTTMCLVIRLNVVINIVYISSHFRTEQHPCLHVALISTCHRACIHCREREGGIRDGLHIKFHHSTRLEPLAIADKGDAICRRGFRADEEKTVGQNLPIAIEDRQRIDAFLHGRSIQFKLDEWRS